MCRPAESNWVLPGLRGAFDPSLIFLTQGALSVLQLLSAFNFTRVLINQFDERMQRSSPGPRACVIFQISCLNDAPTCRIPKMNPVERLSIQKYPKGKWTI